MTRSNALFQSIVDSARQAAEAGNWDEWLESCPSEDDLLDWKAGDAYTRPRKEEESDADHQKETVERLKAVWSKYCGAFANTSGGVLVFGVGEKGAGTDKKPKWKLCFAIAETRRRLLTFTQTNCEPPVSHIEVEAFQVGNEEGKGLLICHIPESNGKPHKSLQESKPDFFLRVHDGCYPCPVSLLRSLFLLNPEPRLEMELWFSTVSRPARQDDGVDVEWKLEVINTGENSIRDLRIATEVDYPFLKPSPPLDSWIPGPGSDWARKKREPGPTEFRREPLHPGDRSSLYGGTFTVNELPNETSERLKKVGFGFSIVASALDMRRKRFLVQLSHKQMLELRAATLKISVDALGESHMEIRRTEQC